MPLVSLCMIVRNEEAVLERCLDSVAELVDEIILVDTGSTDDTKKIASKFSAKSTISRGGRFFRRKKLRRGAGGGRLLVLAGCGRCGGGRESGEAAANSGASGCGRGVPAYQLSFDEDGKPQMISCRERIFRRSVSFSGRVLCTRQLCHGERCAMGMLPSHTEKSAQAVLIAICTSISRSLCVARTFPPENSIITPENCTTTVPIGQHFRYWNSFAGWKGLGTGLHGSVSALRKLLPKTETAGAGAEKPAACAGIRCADAGALL